MKILIAYRGFHYKQGDGTDTGLVSKSHLHNGLPFNIDMVAANHRETIFDPLRNMGHELRIIGCTYPSPDVDRLRTELQHDHVEIIPSENSRQMSTMTALLRLVHQQTEPFDWLLILRYDLIYRHPIDRWGIRFDRPVGAFYIPFISTGGRRNNIMVSDCLYCIPSPAMESFIYQCFVNRNEQTNHHIIVPFRSIVKGIYDANTSIQYNPLYIMAGRPITKPEPMLGPLIRQHRARRPR
jgi:hypothetical protein